MKSIRLSLGLTLFSVLLCSSLSAQQDKASMVGTITDAQNAAIPGAKVTVMNVHTGYSFQAASNAEGRYTTPQILPPGDYTLSVTATGFKKVTSQPITLQVGETREVNLALQIGAATEVVTVTAEAPLLSTESSDTGAVIT